MREKLRRLDLKVGFACNNKCVFCAQGDKRSRCGALPFERLSQELVRLGPRRAGLVLTGGEPTLHRQLLPLVRLARQLGYAPIQLQTNGRLLSLDRALDSLVAAGITEFSPSLHGATAEVHDALTRAPGSHAQTVRGIANVVERGLTLITNSVITQLNLLTLPKLVTLLAELGVRQAQLAFVHPVGTAWAEFCRVVPRLAELPSPLRAARERARGAGLRLVTEAVPLCFLRGMAELAVERFIPLTTVADLGGTHDHSAWRSSEGKVHGPPCETCAARGQCEGPWAEYPRRRGWGEFVPLDTEPC